MIHLLENNQLINEVAKAFLTTPEEMLGNSQKHRNVTGRYVVAWFLKKHMMMTYEEIGTYLHRTKATIRYGAMSIEDYRSTHTGFNKRIDALENQLLQLQ